jgi:hypothetical protein
VLALRLRMTYRCDCGRVASVEPRDVRIVAVIARELAVGVGDRQHGKNACARGGIGSTQTASAAACTRALAAQPMTSVATFASSTLTSPEPAVYQPSQIPTG